MSFDLQETLSYFAPVFVAMDPFGQVPLFLSLAGDLDKAEQRRLLLDTALVSGILGIVFALSGLWLLQVMGMTLADFRIGGGLVFMIIAIRIILGLDELHSKPANRGLVGVVPLATPAIVGPAVIANIVLLSHEKSVFYSLAVFLLNLVFTLALLYNATLIETLLGRKGTRAISKVFAILLVGLAVMFIRQGIVEIVTGLPR